jgi:CubicO group peptidase (beta-lactamase class C family)
MRSRKKRLLILLPAIILLLGAVAALWIARSKGPRKPTSIPQGDYSYAKALAQHRVEQVMRRRHIPGVAAVMIDDQEIIWQASFGLADVEQETPVTADTVFKLWSLAKPFTAMELMRLVEQGQLDLDAPLEEYVPGFSIHSRFPDGEPITLRHILAHRSGLPRNACQSDFGWETGPEAMEHLAIALEGCFLAYPTGERYKYSNIGYVTLGYIIQDLAGRAFPPYMRDQLLLPVGMRSSAFYSSDLPPGSELAAGYEYFDGEYYRYEQQDIGDIPSGNLYATSGDLATFVKFFFRGGEAAGKQLIRPETLNAMTEDQYSRPADPQRMGLGWKLGRVADSEHLVWHDGGPAEGIGSLIAMLPERKLGFVLLGNASTFEGSVSLPIAVEVLEVMLETREGVAAPEEEPVKTLSIEPSVLEKYAGEYAAFGDILEVSTDGERLKGSIQGMSFDLVPIAENTFRISHWLLTLGLADLLQLPVALDQLEITFQIGEGLMGDNMIVNFGDFNHEVYPRIPPLADGGSWQALPGKYELYAKLPSGLPGPDRLGERDITLEDGHLYLSGTGGPIVPIDDDTLIILGGPFHGETIARDSEIGALSFQGVVFKPVSSPVP